MTTKFEDLDLFIKNCYLDYAAAGMETGDLLNEWEEAHHPIPKCKGGTETTTLLKRDHAIHNVMQSEVFSHPCIFGWEADYLEGELYDLCKKWQSVKGENLSESVPLETRKRNGQRNVESGHLRSISSHGGKNGTKSQIENKIGIYGASPEKKREWALKANAASNPKAPWWTDGVNDKKCVKQPGPNWFRGRSKTRKKHG